MVLPFVPVIEIVGIAGSGTVGSSPAFARETRAAASETDRSTERRPSSAASSSRATWLAAAFAVPSRRHGKDTTT